MPVTTKSPSERQLYPIAVASLAGLAVGAVAAAVVANLKGRNLSIEGYPIQYPVKNHKSEDPIYILVGGRRENEEFSETMNDWFAKTGLNTTLFGYDVSVSEPGKSQQKSTESLVSSALSSNTSQLNIMSSQLATLIAEAANHSNTVVVQSYQGTDLLSEQSVKLLPAEIQKKVNLLSLAATLK